MLFFSSASALLNFFTIWISNVTQVLLNTCKRHHTQAHYISIIFVSMSRPKSIYFVSM